MNNLILLIGFFFALSSCTSVNTAERPVVPPGEEGSYSATNSGCRLFVYDSKPAGEYSAAIFMLAGITGINHNKEQDIIQILSNGQNRVVVIHPRGTGYSDGRRGDIHDFSDFISDYVEVISHDPDQSAV